MSESSDKNDDNKKKDKRGILRLDINKPRNSAGSVEFRDQPELLCEASPSPQSTQLSVKWAFPKDTNANATTTTAKADNEYDVQVRHNPSEKRAKKSLSADYFGFHPYYDPFYMDSIDVPEYINSEDEDYSLSLSAVIQRRASVRGRKKGYYSPRRASSPMGHVSGVCGIAASNSIVVSKADRRRSSVYTTSSGETAISLGDAANNQESTKEQIFENIRLHKEVLQSVKMQPWSMRRKLRLVRQAREYIARHEGALQERFAMSRSTKDLWARFKIVLAVKWQHFRRELANLSTLFVAWQLRIKEIESHFGSAVASYFTFLRWLFWVNLVLALTLSVVILPEFFASQFSGQNDHRKVMMPQERVNATSLTTFLNFEGYLKYSPLFYGYYSDYSGFARIGLNISLPLLYFFAGVAVYIYSFWATLRKMAENSRMSKMSSKDDECIFSWKLFTGWDYMIGHAETAHNRIASVVLGFKEALLEEAEKKKDTQNWRVIALRIFVNIVVLCLLVLSAWAVVTVVELSSNPGTSYLQQNATSFLMTGISFFFPMFFEFLGYFEHYHPRKQLRWQLGRIMLLNLLNLFSMIIALFKKIYLMNQKLDEFRQCPPHRDTLSLLNDTTTTISTFSSSNNENGSDDFATIASTLITTTTSELIINLLSDTTPMMVSTDFFSNCCVKVVNCSRNVTAKSMIPLLLAMNFTTMVLPEIWQQMNGINGTMTTPFTEFDFYLNDTITTEAYNMSEYMNDTFMSTTNAIDNLTTLNALDDYEATTQSQLDEYEDQYNDENYDDTGGDSGDGGGGGDRLRRSYRNAIDLDGIYSDADYDYGDGDGFSENGTQANVEMENNFSTQFTTVLTSSVDDYDEYSENDIDDDTDDMNKLLSSTVTSFLENATFVLPTFDPFNETYVSELWTEYIMKFDDETDNELDCNNGTDYTTDDPNECGRGWINICYESTTEPMDSEIILTTPQNDRSPMQMQVSQTTRMFRTTPQMERHYSSTVPSTTSFSTAITQFINNETSLINSTKTTPSCVPFTRQSADNITGIPSDYVGEELSRTIEKLDVKDQLKLREMCWETIFGQELVKLTVFDLVFNTFTILFMDFFRALFVRFMNKCWCWDLEKKYPKYGDFKIAENILHLVNNQGQVWMGLFFSPGLAILNLIKLGILMYLRSWAVLTCNVPHEVVFRASRSNNFYLALLLTMLFLCVLPVSYAIVWIEPSWHCGPFANHARIYRVFTDTLKLYLPKDWHTPLDIIASPSTVIPLLLLLILIIYYLVSLTGALREANQDLKNQLRRERQEERRKMLQRVVNAKLDDSGGSNAIDRWRKVLEASSPVTPSMTGQQAEPDEEKIKARREFLARIMKKALRKSSNTSEDESHAGIDDGDETDTEQHEPLPHDQETTSEKRTPIKRKNSNVHLLDDRKDGSGTQRKLSFTRMRDIVEIARRKSEQLSDGTKLIKTTEAIEEEKKPIEESNRNNKKVNQDDDDYNKVNVVSERRALRRQQNARESDGSLSLQTLPDTTNYNTVNEKKSSQTHKKSIKPHSPATKVRASPEIFKFDATVTHESKGTKENNGSDLDQTTSKEIVHKTKKGQSSSKDGSATSITAGAGAAMKNSSSQSSIQLHSPKETENSSSASTPRGSIGRKSKEQIPSPSSSEKLKQDEDILRQPMRKLNSFLALVREAVQAKKHEQQQQQQLESGDKILSPSTDLQSRVKTFIDDSNSVSMSEEGGSTKTTTESTTTTSSRNTTYFESIRRKRRSDPPKPKRQDSQTSIWSENIPVITISKSESDECILERENDENESDSETNEQKQQKQQHQRRQQKPK